MPITIALDDVGVNGDVGVLGRRGWDEFVAAAVRAVVATATDPAQVRGGVTDQRASPQGALDQLALTELVTAALGCLRSVRRW